MTKLTLVSFIVNNAISRFYFVGINIELESDILVD